MQRICRHGLEFRGHCERLGYGRLVRLHRVHGLEHRRDLRPLRLRDLGQHVAVEVHGAAPAGGPGKDLRYRADHLGGLVAREHPHAAQPGGLEPREELAWSLQQ